MPYQSRRKNTAVVARLADDPQNYPFIQAVRLLERAVALACKEDGGHQYQTRNSVGRYSPPEYECIRFQNSHTLSFANSDVVSVEQKGINTEASRWQVVTSFMGVTGAHGVMPYSFTETVLQRLKQKDPSLSKFLDLFNHRILSLFYQASIKYKPAINYERKRLPSRGNFVHNNDSATQMLRAITGLGTRGLDEQISIPAEHLLHYAGLLSQKVRTATGLQQLLSSYFNVPIKLYEFRGRWQEVIDDFRSRLPDFKNPKGQNVCLGRSAMLGKRGWVSQGKIEIEIGPLSQKQFQQFAPGRSALKAMNELVRFYIGIDNDYEFKILVDRHDIPEKITLGGKSKPIMGWSTWLPGGPHKASSKNQTISISVSSNNL